MERRDGRWRDVEPGNYVRDQTGKVWRVDSWNHSTAHITDRGGRRATARPNPYDKVQILTPTMEEAVSVVERILGGVVISDERTGT